MINCAVNPLICFLSLCIVIFQVLYELLDPILRFPQTSDYLTNYEQNGAHCSEQEQTYLLSGMWCISLLLHEITIYLPLCYEYFNALNFQH